MSLHREVAKFIHKASASKAVSAVPQYRPQLVPIKPNFIQKLYFDNIKPLIFTYIKAPFDRWNYAEFVREARKYGCMYDDLLNDRDPLIERAIALMPPDLLVGRYRRLMRAANLNYLKLHVPLSEQNYDPMLPYLAPYIEEAKFQMQEEEELLGFHPYDRRLYRGGTTGWGDVTPFGPYLGAQF
eukprot:GDKI01031166.1.p2 GENE.GDKI01031166.1~~GDKI01031166.1.p2  ORF type:complete len:184 (-),score=40.40 GDKI01031166.1:140-691(-)